MLSTYFLIESLEQSDTWMKKLRLRETKLPVFTQMLRIKTGLWIWLQSIKASTFEQMTTLEDRKNYTSPWCLSQERTCIPKVTLPSTLPKPDVDIENTRRKIKNFHMYIHPISGGARATVSWLFHTTLLWILTAQSVQGAKILSKHLSGKGTRCRPERSGFKSCLFHYFVP